MSLQYLVGRAYDRWHSEWQDFTYGHFVNRLDYAERLAVLTGNLNYQVENGGWVQWFDNRYGDHASTIRSMLLPYVEKHPSVGEVVRLMDRAVILWNHHKDNDHWPDEFNTLDTAYYAINKTLLESLDGILSAEVANHTR